MRKTALCVLALSLSTPLGAAPRGSKPPAEPPLVRSAPVEPSPGETILATYRDWVVGDMDDYTSAYTTNGDDSVFGMMCSSGCSFYLAPIDCERGADYPVIMNSKQGSVALELSCIEIKGQLLLSTGEIDPFLDMVKGGGEVSFALPLEAGRFDVSRFSLKGGAEALVRAAALSIEKRKPSGKGLRDTAI